MFKKFNENESLLYRFYTYHTETMTKKSETQLSFNFHHLISEQFNEKFSSMCL